MRTVSVPVAVVGVIEPQLRIQTLQWPARCACCGEPNQGRTLKLRDSVYAGSGNILDQWKRGVIPVYHLSWQLPCCPQCVSHHVEVQAVPVGLLFLLAFVLWAGALVGYQVYVGDLAHNILAKIAWVGLGAIFAYPAFRFNDWMEGLAKRIAQSRMKPTCTAQMLPVSIRSDLQHIDFTFQNDAFADEFRALNQL